MLGIGGEEYARRQQAMRRLAARSGLRGVVAWSRGGSAQDRYADVYYLTGFYQHQPFVPDVPGRWRAQGHAAVLLPVEGPALLLTDASAVQEPRPAARLRTARDLVDALAERIRALPPGRIGLIGCEVMAAPWWRRLHSVIPGHELVGADDLGWQARRRKSPAELDLLRAAGALGRQAMAAARQAATPGATEAEVAAAAIAEITRAGGAYYGMGVSSGAESHTFAASGPAPYRADRRLAAGDLFRIDLYGSVHGYLFDLARSWVVGAEPTTEQRRLLDAVRESVQAGIEMLRPGRRIGEVARRCQEVFERSAFAAHHGMSGFDGVWGHGLGLSFEPPWVEQDGPSAGERLEAGMCLALECRISMPSVGGAGYEDDVIVTDSGPEPVTAPALHTLHAER
ncbi:aminopeptidase P family protein [Nonomuraea sp. K274]|uniref:Aminopeptidase P family protein n=1 Tax=Nonomuraea cypriaca TaxID=1187855 RepID=A0A931AEY5_9ACTN|nr:M24 family metallopeptidase [Nonomuraea cypriaca]MBF8189849.1 aminopeptidase P family protein [Nonomuraea cypriaca]